MVLYFFIWMAMRYTLFTFFCKNDAGCTQQIRMNIPLTNDPHTHTPTTTVVGSIYFDLNVSKHTRNLKRFAFVKTTQPPPTSALLLDSWKIMLDYRAIQAFVVVAVGSVVLPVLQVLLLASSGCFQPRLGSRFFAIPEGAMSWQCVLLIILDPTISLVPILRIK